MCGSAQDDPSMHDAEPEEGDYVSHDGGLTWLENGNLVVAETEADAATYELYRYSSREQWWPNAWLISDHGNAHLTSYGHSHPDPEHFVGGCVICEADTASAEASDHARERSL